MKYKSGYKYQLVESLIFSQLKYFRDFERADIVTDYINLSPTGKMIIKKGYACDGPSGPTVDNEAFMVPSFVHDALYQLMRMGHLNADEYRLWADQLLREMYIFHSDKIIERDTKYGWVKKIKKMGAFVRASYIYRSVRAFGKSSATGGPKEILEAL